MLQRGLRLFAHVSGRQEKGVRGKAHSDHGPNACGRHQRATESVSASSLFCGAIRDSPSDLLICQSFPAAGPARHGFPAMPADR